MATNNLTITILGVGNIGGTLGRKWHAIGHKVIFGVSDPEGKHAHELQTELGESLLLEQLLRLLHMKVMSL